MQTHHSFQEKILDSIEKYYWKVSTVFNGSKY